MASSFFGNNTPSNSKFAEPNFWQPDPDDVNSYLEFNLESYYLISCIDIAGKPISRHDTTIGYVSSFKIMYLTKDNQYISDNNIYINSSNLIKRNYIDPQINCKMIRVYPLTFCGIKALKVRLYYFDEENVTNNLMEIKPSHKFSFKLKKN